MQVCSSGPAHHPLPLAGLSCSRSSAPRRFFSGRFFLDKLSSNCHQFSSKNCHQLSRISCHQMLFCPLFHISHALTTKLCFKSSDVGAGSPPPRALRVFGAVQRILLPQVDQSLLHHQFFASTIYCICSLTRSSCSEGGTVTIHRGRVILQMEGLQRYDRLGEHTFVQK